MGEQEQYESLQQLNSLDCWDYSIELECLQGTQDLQLAAELGKTLLERNKELENALKQHQNIIEDQTQEIEYLTKQTTALREVNDSRLRIYEQLEISIQDLERANHRLAVENAADKKHIKTLTANIETLEGKCDDLQGTIDDLRIQVDILKRKAQRPKSERTNAQNRDGGIRLRHVNYGGEDEVDQADVSVNSEASYTEKLSCENNDDSPSKIDTSSQSNGSKQEIATNTESPRNDETDSGTDQMSQLLSQLRETRSQCNRDQRRITELEEQLATMVQQNQALENQLMQIHNNDADIKSMHDELTTLEEVREGQMCSRCLRRLNRSGDEMSMSLCDEPEDDDASMLEALCNNSHHRTSFTMEVQELQGKTSSPHTPQSGGNLYRDLVQKYEALLEIHRKPAAKKGSNCLSLQEEMQMSGEFNALSTKDTDEESGHGDSLKPKSRKAMSHTPTDFSEAETSSSGFADETSNKGTQTEGRPGAFLCTIADGEDCRFSIYDDASPIDSRFRSRPEYRDLFKEIFTVLKKAAENKDEGDQLPLLDDHTPIKAVPKVPPVTPLTEDLPDFSDNMTDDTQSVISSTMSEMSTSQLEATTVVENLVESHTDPKAEPNTKTEEERVLRPLVRQPLEYISVGVNVRKRSSSRRKNKFLDRSDSPVTHIIGSPKITYSNRPGSGKKSKEHRNNRNDVENNWNGNTLQFWSSRKNAASPTPSQGSGKGGYFEYKPSTASQDLHKLKKLDLSYAEVLRKAGSKNKQEITRGRRK